MVFAKREWFKTNNGNSIKVFFRDEVVLSEMVLGEKPRCRHGPLYAPLGNAIHGQLSAHFDMLTCTVNSEIFARI